METRERLVEDLPTDYDRHGRRAITRIGIVVQGCNHSMALVPRLLRGIGLDSLLGYDLSCHICYVVEIREMS